ncbi:hypothetical protein [Parerythrobacter aestuarii]|uniref:hypothetical protein n=1 Tax=Parerythrobacter aestuarii TaxID=3020909 RepID=UPI0024DEC889|nr:hypothetical protein [Parerythrobacter aestuarii]
MGKIAPDASAERRSNTRLEVANNLEANLRTLDKLGAHIAAAHLDVAITRLREEVG